MKYGIRNTILLLAALLLGLSLAAQNTPDDDVPVLRKRPPAEQPDQPPEEAPPATSQPPSSSSAPPSAEAPAWPAPEATPSTASVPGRTAPENRAEEPRRSPGLFGFDREAATPRIILSRTGGAIRVTVNDPEDAQMAGQIGIRLRNAATQFAHGNFSTPLQTYGQTSPGVRTMRQLHDKIVFTAHAIDGGGELILSSEDAKAVEAIHQFLRSQSQGH